jgi:shikimate dehydrogenase
MRFGMGGAGMVIVPIVGHPVSQVRSPVLFNARFHDRGIAGVMVGIDVLPDAAASFIDALRAWRDTPGCVVTMPYKQQFAGLVDQRTARADLLDAVNVIRRAPDGRLSADMLDGDGFMAAAVGHGFAPAGRTASVVGAGGAGAAIALALRDAGAASVHLTDIVPGRAATLAGRLGAPVTADPADPATLDLIVNASQAGMDGASMPACDLTALRPTCLVADLVTQPEMTLFLLAAERRGLAIQRGTETAEGQCQALGQFLGVWP